MNFQDYKLILNEDLVMHGHGFEGRAFITDLNGRYEAWVPKKGVSPATLEKMFYDANKMSASRAKSVLSQNAVSHPYTPKTKKEEPKQETSIFGPENTAHNNKAFNKDHNQKAYAEAKKAIAEHGTCCVVQATGTGKSSIFTALAEDYADKKVCFISPMTSINDQFKGFQGNNKVGSNGNLTTITYQGILAGYKQNPPFSSIQKDLDGEKVGLLCLDELHRTASAKKWQEALDSFIDTCCDKNTVIVGATATKINKGIDSSLRYNKGITVSNLTLEDAIEKDILPMPNYWNYPIVDEGTKEDMHKMIDTILTRKDAREEAKSFADDILSKYDDAHNEEQMNKMSESLKSCLPSNSGMKILGFASSSEDARTGTGAYIQDLVSKTFPDKKVQIHYIEAGSSSDEEKDFKEFRTGSYPKDEIHIMMAINRFNEGVHADGVDTIFMGRETSSDIIYSQQIGRVLSVDDKKSANVFDLVGNTMESSHDWDSIYESYIKNGSKRGKKTYDVDEDFYDDVYQIYCKAKSLTPKGAENYGEYKGSFCSFDDVYQSKGLDPKWKLKYHTDFKAYLKQGLSWEQAWNKL